MPKKYNGCLPKSLPPPKPNFELQMFAEIEKRENAVRLYVHQLVILHVKIGERVVSSIITNK